MSLKIKEDYLNASLIALRVVLWVEVGFQGLEKLAVSPASKNWTSGPGHHATDEERARGILTRGAKLYRECLGQFVDFRTREGITGDCFSRYGVEYLLNQFRATG